MKTINVQDAVGTILAHDLTQIVPNEFKGSRYKKGYEIKEEDVSVLLSMGKEHLYVLDLEADDVHEDPAAIRIATATAGEGTELKIKGEGKVEILAAFDGLLSIKSDEVFELINDDEIMFATIHPNQMVEKGQVLAGTRVIPLIVKEKQVETAEKYQDIVKVLPLKSHKVGIVTTGSELYHGRIKDAFGDVLRAKFSKLGSRVIDQIICDDDEPMIANAILKLIDDGADFIAVTGGMSVDPDDRTPSAIRHSGAKIITYGAPVLPGAMFLLGYIGEIPVVGLPGCVMYHGTSIFDLMIPRILAGIKPTREDIKRLAIGGLCRNCKVCTYTNCGFGKGI